MKKKFLTNEAEQLNEQLEIAKCHIKELIQYLEIREDYIVEDAEEGEINCYKTAKDFLNKLEE